MIDYIKAWLARRFPPTIASVYQREWNQSRRQRQIAFFVVDPLALFSHGIDK